MSEPLLCCMTDAFNHQYSVPHHHPEIRVRVVDDSMNPSTTGQCFNVYTPDGLLYQLGCTADSLRSTVTFNNVSYSKIYNEWDVNSVSRTATNTATGYLQSYTVSYWQDIITDYTGTGNFPYTRDAGLKEIDYNFDASGHALSRVLFNVYWPQSTQTSGSGATATQYQTGQNCSSQPQAPLQETGLRCDDPTFPSGLQFWEPAPLNFSTLTLNSVVMQVSSGGAWSNVRRYDFTYNADSPQYTCYDPVTPQWMFACSGEHTLYQLQETPYQGTGTSATPMPSRQPITFTMKDALKNEYHDTTETNINGQIYDVQTYWSYLKGFTDGQTGASETVTWKTGYGNTNLAQTDPTYCDSHSCSFPGQDVWRQLDLPVTTTTSSDSIAWSAEWMSAESCWSWASFASWAR